MKFPKIYWTVSEWKSKSPKVRARLKHNGEVFSFEADLPSGWTPRILATRLLLLQRTLLDRARILTPQRALRLLEKTPEEYVFCFDGTDMYLRVDRSMYANIDEARTAAKDAVVVMFQHRGIQI